MSMDEADKAVPALLLRVPGEADAAVCADGFCEVPPTSALLTSMPQAQVADAGSAPMGAARIDAAEPDRVRAVRVTRPGG